MTDPEERDKFVKERHALVIQMEKVTCITRDSCEVLTDSGYSNSTVLYSKFGPLIKPRIARSNSTIFGAKERRRESPVQLLVERAKKNYVELSRD